jgi:hypothetical protein
VETLSTDLLDKYGGMAYTLAMGRKKGGKNAISGKIETTCLECKKTFLTHPCRFKNIKSGGIFCSRECRNKSQLLKDRISLSHGGKLILKCSNCKKEFRTYPYRVKQNEGNFCSRKCYGEFYALPEEVLKEHKQKWIRENQELIKEGQKKWRKENWNHIQKEAHKHYTNNKDEYLKRAKIGHKKYLIKYKNNEDFNRHQVIKSAQFIQEKKKKNPKWYAKVSEKQKEYETKKNNESKEWASSARQLWMGSEMDYLKENYLTKSNYEMAIHLGRSNKAVYARMYYCYKHYHWPRRLRKLKGVYY